ncbi:MAG: YraN family protein [Flavobacteriaceae bacterium]
MTVNHKLGKLGEELAVKYLITNGYTILQRNYRHRKAEIDIIAQKDEILAIVEVKSRSGGFYESLENSISRKKRNLLIMAADEYVQQNDLDLEVRFDIVIILSEPSGYTIEHYADAFFHF